MWRRKPRVRISAMMSGGGQERGMRSGTLSPALCVGLGEACRIYTKEMNSENKKLIKLKTFYLMESEANVMKYI